MTERSLFAIGSPELEGEKRGPVRLLVADDSPTVRFAVAEICEGQPGIELVGAAADGLEALSMTARLKPDVILMDVVMPRMDGVAATHRIMSTCPTPIVIFSGMPGLEDAAISFDAIDAGAIELIAKPDRVALYRDPARRRGLVDRLKELSRAVVGPQEPVTDFREKTMRATEARIIVLGASTGGPRVLRRVLRAATTRSPPIVLLQKLSRRFVDGFASWLDAATEVPVRVATRGVVAERGCIYVTPEGSGLVPDREGRFHADEQTPGASPATIEHLMRSASEFAKDRCVGIAMSGAGRDGAAGLAAIREVGGLAVAQAAETCVMPAFLSSSRSHDTSHVAATPDTIESLLAGIDHALQ